MFKKLPKFNELSYIHFVTTNTANRLPFFKNESLCRILADNIRFYEKKFDLEVYGWVILPDHLHLLVWWDGDKQPELTISKVIQGIKGASARQIIDILWPEQRLRPTPGSREPLLPTKIEPLLPTTEHQAPAKSHKRNLKYQIWQPGFYDFNIYSDYKLEEKLNYIINNPVKVGLVQEWTQYKWIYINNYLNNGS